MPPRLEEYRVFLSTALECDYQIRSVRSFWRETRGQVPKQKYLVLRHDVDTDTGTAKAMFGIERQLDVQSTYYFRLETLDSTFMQLIEATGSEAGYHFEEIAALAKAKGLRKREHVKQHLDLARQMFCANLAFVRKTTGLPITTVASHGDFVNRTLKMPNWELINQELREQMGLEFEAYDELVNRCVTSRHSDTHYPRFWKPSSPLDAIGSGEPVVYVLVHPRHWRTNFVENAKDNTLRLWEGIRYAIK
jgi:hypothetical protein